MHVRSAAAVVGVVAVFASVCAAIALPWRDAGDAADRLSITKYVRYDDGASQLVRHDGPDGDVTEWLSRSIEVFPGLRALGDLPRGLTTALIEHVAGKDGDVGDALDRRSDLVDARVVQLQTRRLAADGGVVSEVEVLVIDHRGVSSLGYLNGADGTVTRVDPPLQLLPADPEVGMEWEAEGTLGALPYRFTAAVADIGPAQTAFGDADDCITVDATFTLDGAETITNDYSDTYCAGIGWAKGSVDGNEPSSYTTVSIDGRAPTELPAAAASPRDASTARVEPATWAFTRVGAALPLSTGGGSTFAATWVPSDPPMILAGTDAGGDLVALGATGVLGNVLWRMPTAGAVYSEPAYDPARGRLYFGASDGVVRAVDERGLFLWSVRTGDNVPGTPVLVDDTVVVGSEDGLVYGIDADRGELAWTTDAGGPVASSPAALGDLAVVADDGGSVFGIAADDGGIAWTYTAGDGVDAGLVATDEGVIVADRIGGVTLVGADGTARWHADGGDQIAVRTAPAVIGDDVLVVNEIGDLAALSLADGEVRWRLDDEQHVGTPAPAGDDIAVALDDGYVRVLDDDGEEVERADARDAMSPTDQEPSFSYGVTVGDGALWTADDEGVIRRLGRVGGGSAALEAAWLTPTLSDPFVGFSVVTTPAVWGESLVVIDVGGNLHVVDAATGVAGPPTEIGVDDDSFVNGPVVAGDVLIADTMTRLVAFGLPAGDELWSVPFPGERVQSPVVAGDLVVAVAQDGDAARIDAYEIATGELAWSVPTGAAALSSRPAVLGDLVVAGAPLVGIDVDGDVQWTTEIDSASGEPTVIGDELAVATFSDGDEEGGLSLLDVTGEVQWSVTTEGHALPPTSALLAVGGVIVLPSVFGPAVGYDSDDGERLWETPIPGTVLGVPAAIDDAGWIALESGQVLVLDAAGDVVASFEGFGAGIGATSIIQRPVDVGDAVVFTAGSVLFAIGKA